jgi:hypothetical protein
MKRYFTLLLLTLPVSASAGQNVGQSPAPAGFFVGGCGLILLTVVWLSWKTKKMVNAGLEKAELSSRYEARYESGEFPIVGFPDSAHAGGRDS